MRMGEANSIIRSEWVAEVIKAMQKVGDGEVFMALAYDGFFGWEVALHLLGSSPTDGLTMAWLVAELEGYEVVKSGKCLAKRLKKFERFPG